MLAAPFIMAASQLFAAALAAPILKSPETARSLMGRSPSVAYSTMHGDGTTTSGWPAKSSWASFDQLWDANVNAMSGSCSQFGQQNNSPEETANIKKALVQIAAESNIPSEVLLVFMMQESKGCVRAPTTNYGHDNPGLMQSFEGTFSCNPSGSGTVPCPAETITGMIREGAGIGRPFGLMQAIEQSKSNDVSKFYKGARIYNSGSVDPSGDLGKGIATNSYASDMANRLRGWAGDMSEFGTAPTTPIESSVEVEEEKAPAEPTAPKVPTSTTEHQTKAASKPNAAIASGASEKCTSWYTVQSGDSCFSTGIDFAKLRELNTEIDSSCSNLWAGYAYCVAA